MGKTTIVLCVALLTLGVGSAVAANFGPDNAARQEQLAPCPNPDCPDADGDGICNGEDPDYVPAHPNSPNPDCPDADGDGICNGQDPDYEPPYPDCPNPDCPDADGDGICNGQDPDYSPIGPVALAAIKTMLQLRLGW